jgi:DNA-binding CsgD family transcriptional regulator
MRAHCEHLQQELKVNEADSILTELEDLQDFVGDKNELPIKFLHLENHRLNCLLNANYKNNIEPTINAVERALLNDHHAHVTRRAERSLLNLWAQSEQVHPISQWYVRQALLTDKPNGPDGLLHLRNLMFAYLWLKDFGVVRERKWKDITKSDVKTWLRVWPQMASGVAFLWSVCAVGEHSDDVALMQNRAFGWMSQCNDLAEPLAYLPCWFNSLNQPDRPLQRFQSTFLSRLKSIRGPKSLSEPVQLTTQAPGLSRREWQFLEQISSGASNEALATQFNLSLGTVKNHLTRLYRKLGVTGRSAACARYKSMVPAAEVNQA